MEFSEKVTICRKVPFLFLENKAGSDETALIGVGLEGKCSISKGTKE